MSSHPPGSASQCRHNNALGSVSEDVHLSGREREAGGHSRCAARRAAVPHGEADGAVCREALVGVRPGGCFLLSFLSLSCGHVTEFQGDFTSMLCPQNHTFSWGQITAHHSLHVTIKRHHVLKSGKCVLLGQHLGPTQVTPCPAGSQRLAELWGDPRKREV